MWGCLVCANTEKPLYRLFQRRAPKSPVMIAVLLLGLFGVTWADNGSTPYKNSYYVPCTSIHRNCVENKCVMLGRGITLCTECKSDKVPINGACFGKDNDSSIDISVCTQGDGDNGGKRCTACNGGSARGDDTYFLFYGGCYNKTEWPGSHICKTVSGGMCSECNTDHGVVFKNEGPSASEKCILCGDNVGFNGKAGIAGCATCVLLDSASPSTNTASTAAVQCTSCVADDMAPIDGQCAAIDSNRCQNGYCTHCVKGYVYHKGGCYSTEAERDKICAEANQFEIDDYSACKQCANSNEIPHNGNCRPVSERGNCNKVADSGKCTSCDQNTPGSTVFFYEGGCYTTDDFLGGTICTKASAGKCTTCNEENGYFKKDLTCARCDTYITNCVMCVLGTDTASNPVCTGCRGNQYANIEGTSCVSSCPSGTPGRCSESGICRCECGTGTYFNTASTSCESCNQVCLDCKGPGSDECVSCTQDKYMKISTSGTLTCVDADGCGEGSYPNNDSHVCAPCNINLCRICNSGSAGIKCTECSSGYLSLDGSSCSSQCTEPNQRKGDNNKCVCVDGFQPDDSGTCVATNTCPQQNSGCSSCNAAGECLSCLDSAQSIQPGRRSCAAACPEGSQLIGTLCTCMDGYALQGDACVSRSRRASSSSTVAVVSVVVALLVVAAAALACWFVLRRRRRGPRGASGRKRSAAEHLELMGTVDEF
ncbi:Variant-specific surface protein [Giardia duodenalis assemblage B]|uniref:Variant-specific surface protein n=1 Tax=Giardia duodenalis assemblage B TaxID=1394984 RepID=A0A132NMC2_GIAIN|nr:Variant-specific surface protein [Giardia intestinalis assemblage B]